MPGVLIVEAMAQIGGVMMLAPDENRGKLAYFLAADKVKFRKTVLPGDQLILEAEAIRIKAKRIPRKLKGEGNQGTVSKLAGVAFPVFDF